jgi:hypothetical protein
VPPLDTVLEKLPWFRDLTRLHRDEMLDEVQSHLKIDTTRDEYASLLERWAGVAHGDAKWTRFELLRESGLLAA